MIATMIRVLRDAPASRMAARTPSLAWPTAIELAVYMIAAPVLTWFLCDTPEQATPSVSSANHDTATSQS
jgi:hypothetical protein